MMGHRYSVSVRHVIKNRTHILMAFVFLIGLLGIISPSQAQTNPLRIRKTIVGNLTTVEVGQIFQYRITVSCNNLTTSCGDLTLTDMLPDGLELLGISGPVEDMPATNSAIKYIYEDLSASEIVIRNKRGVETGADVFEDGEIVEFLLTVRVEHDATPGLLENNLTGDVSQQDGGGNPPPVVIPPVGVTLLPPDPPAPDGSDWTYEKSQAIPIPPQDPTTDQPVLYQIRVCPVNNTGIQPHTSMTITDSYPPGAIILDADGGTEIPPQIEWQIPDSEVADALINNTCIEREVLMSYPSPDFSGVAGLSNTIVVTSDQCTLECGTSSVDFDIAPPNVEVETTKSVSGSPVGAGGIGRFFLNVNPNQGNVPAPNLVLQDTINDQPNEYIQVIEIQSGRWQVIDALQPFVNVRARVEYDSSGGGTTTLATVDGATNIVWGSASLPTPPQYVSAVRWVFEYQVDGGAYQAGLPVGFVMVEPPEIVFTPMQTPTFPNDFVPDTYQNCSQATYVGGAGTSQSCINYELGDPVTSGTNIETSKSSPAGAEFAPMEEFPLELRLRLSERALLGSTITNPSIIDVLPPQLEFVRWDSVTFNNVSGPLPFMQQVGNTIQWYWANTPLPNSVIPGVAGLPATQNAPPATPRTLTMTANGQDQEIVIRFTVRITAGTPYSPDGTFYTNQGYFIGPDTPICESGTLELESALGIDDGDGIDENVCHNGFNFRVRRALALEGFKWVRSPNYAASLPEFPEFAMASDNTMPYATSSGDETCSSDHVFEYPSGSGILWTRFPCVAFGFPESPITSLPPTGGFVVSPPDDDQIHYLIDIRNTGNVSGSDYYLYDVLPRLGDTGSGGPLSATPRQSTFSMYLTSPVVPFAFTGVANSSNIIIEYSQATQPCRPEVFDDPAQGGCTNDWSPTFPSANPRSVTAFRIRFAPNMEIAVNGRMLFQVNSVIAYDAVYGNAQAAWNSFAHTAINAENTADGFLPPAEPRKAGVRIPERFSIGNRVWRDSDNSGTINAPDDTNPGIANVLVHLYADFDGNGVPDSLTPIATRMTDANGYYLFDDIIPNTNPNLNRYIVGIPASNFNSGNPLYNLRSSTGVSLNYVTPPENNNDSDDNGIDPIIAGGEVLSATIHLTLYNERVNETDLSGNPIDGAFSRGTRGQSNNNSDLSIDFGFFGGGDEPFSIGNRIFLDDGADGIGGFNSANRNNGIQDANEVGINNIRVELYRDGNGNGRPDTNEFVRFDVTASGTGGNGYYLFDNLDAGTYFVVIPSSQFAVGQPLAGWHSSTFNGTETLGATGAVGTPPTDLDDNGIEPVSRRPDLNGVRSGAIVFERGVTEVTGETDLSNEADPGLPNNAPDYNGATGEGPTGWDGPNSIGRWALGLMTDSNSNMAVDFGFIPPMSIGNRVWLDDSSDPNQWLTGGSRNNGVIDATDDGNLTVAGIQNPGIAGVQLQLYYDENNNNTIDGSDTLVITITTDANGYYLFDGLAPGNYIIRIPSNNFASGMPLNGLISSYDATAQTNPTNTVDNNDNGIDNANPALNGIRSQQITLIYLSEPTGESDLAPANPHGRFGEVDDDSDLTIDFGFVRPPMSIGNQVWMDNGGTSSIIPYINNGIFDPGEEPIAGVEVALYRDLNSDGVVDSGEDTGLRDITDTNGFYLFSNLPPGDYIIGILASNFTTGNPLFELTSSVSSPPNPLPSDNQTDNNDNGIDNALAIADVLSSRITLSYGTEPNDEVPHNDPLDGSFGRGYHGERDNDSDLTIDFGFFRPMSLGNLVWLDDGAGIPANRNNGILDVGEIGIANVRVELYRDGDDDDIFDPTMDILMGFDITDSGGFYLFDGLIDGTYFVFIPPVNFASGNALANYNNSNPVDAPAEDTIDNNDVGIDDNFPAVNGIVSVPFTLAYNSEPTGESVLSTSTATIYGNNPTASDGVLSRGRHHETDNSSNLTVDFGFVPPLYSIGNRVWADIDNSGTITAGDDFNPSVAGDQNGIPNVQLTLYRDNGDGVFNSATDTIVAMTMTDANGYYLFEGLSAGNYFVRVNSVNFRVVGGVPNSLFDWYSSTSTAAGDATAANIDNDDNGVDNTVPDFIGIVSGMFTLSKNNEPIFGAGANDETDLSTNPAHGVDGRGNNREMDSDSNLTLDFGFYRPMSIGNRVWADSDGDGVIDIGSESGIPNVTVELYRGSVDPLNLLASVTTDSGGYYLFDNLTPANDYIVHIPASNFASGGALEGNMSTADYVGGINGVDMNDDGLDAVDPTVTGISSRLLTLQLAYRNTAPHPQPINESDLSNNTAQHGSNSRGRFGEIDANSDLTIDFGFVGSLMSLGNRVWFDGNNNGVIDPTDDFIPGGAVAPGIPNVTVRLFADTNMNGIPDSSIPVVPDVVTDANGYYLFENINQGNYIVALPNSNFNAGQPLEGLLSSTGHALDDQTDDDDNGIDLRHPTYGLLTTTINLTFGAEPLNEADLSPAGHGAGVLDEDSDLTIDFGLYRPMSIGNRLWFDSNNNSLMESGETPVPAGVWVDLYRDDDEDGNPDGLAIFSTTTDLNGYYLFDGLSIGRYIVIVREDNFYSGGLLEHYMSSPGEDSTNNTDLNDNGINNPDPSIGGVRSQVVTLATNQEPTNDNDRGPQGHGTNGETNNNSNLTIDFGFVSVDYLSIGNLVWLDDGGTTGIARNGIRDGDELPLAGVVVNLYRDVDGNGIPDDLSPASSIVATDTTDANGHYLFDNLAIGQYIVGLDGTNFAVGSVLESYGSTTTASTYNLNNNDYGIDTPSPINGIFSHTVRLDFNLQPVGDDDLDNTKGYGAGGVDENGNMTVDFGLHRPMSIGNRVWFDVDANGTIGATENGIAGVTLELRQDDGDGVFDPVLDVLVTTVGVNATDITNNRGYYLFDNLEAGNYFVYIPPSQFASGGALDGFTSTVDNVGGINADSNDNGIDDPDPLTNGIVSQVIQLTANNAPTHETDFSGDSLAHGPSFIGLNGEINRNSNIAIDFGFVSTPLSIGNRVWLDTGAGANRDNGLIDSDELGIAGVQLNLYVDANNDGTPDGGAIRTTTTDANGYYLFDGLGMGNYIIQVAPSNFQSGGVLHNLFSSSVSSIDAITDMDDNGIDNTSPALNGIFSMTFTLTAGTMPTGESDLSGNPAHGADSRGNYGETDDNSNLTIDFGFIQEFDWGDAPDSYLTTSAVSGAAHQISNRLYMGNIVDSEPDGQPMPGADGDDVNNSNGLGDDEDGVDISGVIAGTTAYVEVVVVNDTGRDATLIGWIDFDGSGTFDGGEASSLTIPSSPMPTTVTLPFNIPAVADIDTVGQTYARFRLTTDPIDATMAGGIVSDGEVEDYLISVNPPGILLTKTDGVNSIVTGQPTTYTINIQYSGLAGVSRIVNDTLTPSGAFVPDSISWTCTANAQASCVTGLPMGTNITSPMMGLIDGHGIDLLQGGEITFQMTGTLRPDYNTAFPAVPNLLNTVSLNTGENDTDENGVIFDPPYGIKTGTLLDETTIRWTMVWYNTGLTQMASIIDVLDVDQTNPTNLICNAFGATTTTQCQIQGGNTIIWNGTMGDGTTLANRNTNRLEIIFDVTIAGPGTYNNLVGITTEHGRRTEVPGIVVYPSPTPTPTMTLTPTQTATLTPEPSPSATLTPMPSMTLTPQQPFIPTVTPRAPSTPIVYPENPPWVEGDVVITKAVDPILSYAGGTVIWTIQVMNPNNYAMSNLTITDVVPAELEILSATSSAGAVLVNGQTITAPIATLTAQQSVFVIVTTRVDAGFDGTGIMNVASVTNENGRERFAHASIVMPSRLPDTGESPILYQAIRWLLVGLAGIVVIGLGYRRYRVVTDR